MNFDRAFQPVCSGGRIYYGSSADDGIHCLEAVTGKRVWSTFTEGPVRVAPTIAGDRVYAGSDDGRVLCLSAKDGSLHWTYRPSGIDRRIIGNGRMISRWPVRTGVVVEDGVGFCGAGLFPTSEGAFLCSFDTATGKERFRQTLDVSANGPMVASDDFLILPTGRTEPMAFSRQDGKRLGSIRGPGGDVVLTSGDLVLAGSGDINERLDVSDAGTRRHLASLPGIRAVLSQDRAYVVSRTQLMAFDWARYLAIARKVGPLSGRFKKLRRAKDEASVEKRNSLKKEIDALKAELAGCQLWCVPCDTGDSLLLAGQNVIAGGSGRVNVYDAKAGTKAWSAEIDGRAHALAVADGRLFVGTSHGAIICFAPDGQAPGSVLVEPSLERGGAIDAFALDGNSDIDPEGNGLLNEQAQMLLDQTGVTQGICLLLDGGAPLACALAQRSQLRILCVEPDPDRRARARKWLARAGLAGSRIVLHDVDREQLPYPDRFANLVVADHLSPDVMRVLRPYGGAACVRQSGAWEITRKGPLEGAGEWTHGLGNSGNTACTMDRHVHGDLELQWFGAPGPSAMADRHHRNVAPLCKDGHLFIPGDDHLFAVDAYNGTPLWQRHLPGSLRLGAFLDCSNIAVDTSSLYLVSGDKCLVLDVANGNTRREISLPQLGGDRHSWGYVATMGKVLVGSGRKTNATYSEQSRAADNELWYDNMSLVTSDYLFGADPATGKILWTYKSGLLLNTSLTLGAGRVYFLETHSPKALEGKLGRMPMQAFSGGPNFLTALDVETGLQVWRREVTLDDCQHIAYLSYADGKLVLSGNKYIEKKLWYFIYGIEAGSGKRVWAQSANSGFSPRGGHGEQNRHPTIVDDVVYAWPRAFNLHDGAPVEGWHFLRQGHGCGNISASADSVFWRGGNPWQRSLSARGQQQRINSITRPGCWINMIPAGGLLLVPEASSGCTCAFPMQTSLAYTAKKGEKPSSPRTGPGGGKR
ncbi:MAG: PQQ-binding-like beta-propeller repeat protein [Verrucomicrobia bacterium]|nr:PQQ-binding-like beta-propeller repeat protein [Verrucomicrobiota bacterium]